MAGALEIRGIKYVVTGDNASVDAANARTADGMRKLERQAEQTKIQFLGFGKQGEVTARQLQALGYQTTDIITQLASGQATWLVLLQQGGQLRDQFGGFTNVFKAVAGVLTLGRVAALGATGAFVGLAAGITLGYTESAEFRKQMALSGNAAGLTAGRVDELSASLAELTGNTRGNAREAVMQLAQSGFTASGAMDSAARAALSLQRVSGESIDDITKRFGEARSSVVRWATEANRSYNYITSAQIEYIRSLEQQGRQQEALRYNFEALAQVMEQRQAPALGVLERAWQAVKNAASGAFDAIKAVGRDETLEQRLDALAKKIGPGEASGNAYFKRFTLPGLRQEQAYLQEQLRMQRAGAERSAAEARAAQIEIEEASKAHQDALLRIAEAGSAKYLAQRTAAIDAEARLQAQRFERFESSPEQYRAQLIATERARFAAEEQALRARQDIERRRKVEGTPAEIKQQEIARTVALIGLDTQLVNLAAKRARFEAEVRDFRAAVPGARGVAVDPALEFRNLERAQQGAVDSAFARGPSNARAVQRDWAQVNAEISAQLITDQQRRGEALLALELQQQRRRQQIGLTTVEEFKALEDGLAEYTRLREAQLTEQLKPEWRKRYEALADELRALRKNTDSAIGNLEQAGASSWGTLLSGGKGAAAQLRQAFNNEFARIGWDRYLARPFFRALDAMFKAINGLGSGGFGTGAAFGNQDLGLFLHSGGVAGMGGGFTRAVNPLVFAGARRYHLGGLAGGEIPAILQRGEEVLTRGDPRHRYNGGGQPLVIEDRRTFNVGDIATASQVASAIDMSNRALEARLTGNLARPGRAAHAAARR